MTIVLANILGPQLLIVAGIIVLLFGGSQLPKLARGLGEAKSEFEKAHSSDPESEPKTTV